MHTEHLQNVRPSWVAFGWFIGAAATSLLLIVMIVLGLIDAQGETGGAWVIAALFLGYAAGGYFTGMRVGLAPILHAVGIGLFSVVVWFFANLLLGEPLDATAWNELSPAFTAGILLLQMVAAAVGARIASRERRAAAPRVHPHHAGRG
jgi:hypothetical protein